MKVMKAMNAHRIFVTRSKIFYNSSVSSEKM